RVLLVLDLVVVANTGRQNDLDGEFDEVRRIGSEITVLLSRRDESKVRAELKIVTERDRDIADEAPHLAELSFQLGPEPHDGLVVERPERTHHDVALDNLHPVSAEHVLVPGEL